MEHGPGKVQGRVNWKPGDLPVAASLRDDGKVPSLFEGWGLFLKIR
jgi:hypothetical protein